MATEKNSFPFDLFGVFLSRRCIYRKAFANFVPRRSDSVMKND
jgi:hypothetical protein